MGFFITDSKAGVYLAGQLGEPLRCVSCDYSSTFDSVGINQTKHSIYLNVIADISIVMPSRTENFAVATEILIGESVLVGQVPDAYLQSDIFGNKPNLSP